MAKDKRETLAPRQRQNEIVRYDSSRRGDAPRPSLFARLWPFLLAFLVVAVSVYAFSPWLFQTTENEDGGALLIASADEATTAMKLGVLPTDGNGEESTDEDALFASPDGQNYLAYAININGENIVNLATQADAEWVLEYIKAHYEGLQQRGATGFAFVEDVKIVGLSEQSALIGRDDAIIKLLNGNQYCVYVFSEGESLKSVAKKFDMTEEELTALNPGVVANVGNTVYVKNTQSAGCYINAKWTVQNVKEQTVKFTNKNTYDASLSSGTTMVKTPGENGLNRVTTVTVYVNGEKACNYSQTETIKKATQQITVVGTKASGGGGVSGAPKFIWPVTGRISSYYGMRNGRMHYGLDIPKPHGDPIKAAADGTVTAARVNGNYGLMVDIDHGGGYVTRYSHMSSFNCKVGDKVKQGDVIAYIGATGNAEGNHLHFEIRVNNSPKDPLPYLP
ncbi:peptidoglycan DD-metalloendopeptidase family protein [Eubacteriales bacterium OttesenSCG-928-N14]|nr:peptidoglycan DD-metalloendopeptidase family protein [Eubacteriales bacterium OttesenSCG-928-N14]